MRPKKLMLGCALLAVATAATAASAPADHQAPALFAAPRTPLTLADALKVAHRLGPVAGGRTIHLSLALRGRHQAELRRLLDQGRSVDPATLARRYGPDPARTRHLLASLRRTGFATIWHLGDQVAFATAPAHVVVRTFRVRLDRYVTPQGRRFYAPRRQPTLPRAFRPVVSAVVGFDDFVRGHIAAIRPGGVTPGDMFSFYGIKPLHDRGLTGAGETVVFPELMNPSQIPGLLAVFAKRFGLPPFQLTERHGPGWQPVSVQDAQTIGGLGEAAMDLEIVHAIAPGAKLIVYDESASIEDWPRSWLTMVRAEPKSIISDSTNICEDALTALGRRVLAQPLVRGEAQGTTHFVASGDSGAYGCGQDRRPSGNFQSLTCATTSVGGTTVFLSRSGDYYREIAWGNPISEAGGGGGFSHFFARPSWERGQGVAKPQGGGHCVVPHVAALGDANSGWQIRVGGRWIQIAGTSAGAPLWAGLAALINQDLRKKGLRPIGFASPALFWIAQHQAQFDPKPFHDVTEGNNLLYQATPGFDYATGWGTPNAAALATAWEAYRRSGGR
jgi:pro-kumamolisin-like protein